MEKDERDLLVRVDTNVQNLHRELLGAEGQKGRIPALEDRQDEHGKQINFWRGAIAIVGILVLAFGSVLLAHVMGGK